VPDSQENDLGASMRNMAEAARRMNEAFLTIRETMEEADEVAVDIRHGEYPRWDGYGTYWYDTSGMHSNTQVPCFICKQLTHRLDIDFHAYFCNSDACNEEVRKDLESYE
jgi:hypothetical protein